MSDTFWIVWCPTGRTPPSRQHRDQASAQLEAERLARCAPNAEFFVLKAVSRSKKIEVVTSALGDEAVVDLENEVPF